MAKNDTMVRWFVCSSDGPTGWACGPTPEIAIAHYLEDTARRAGHDPMNPPKAWVEERWAWHQGQGKTVAPFLLQPLPPTARPPASEGGGGG